MTDDDSSAEAPEEIKMAKGKELALEKRKGEVANENLIKEKSKQRRLQIEQRNINQKKVKNTTTIEMVKGSEIKAKKGRKSKDLEKIKSALETQATDYEFIPINKKAINRHIYGSSNSKTLPFVDFKTQSLLQKSRRETNEELLGKLEKRNHL